MDENENNQEQNTVTENKPDEQKEKQESKEKTDAKSFFASKYIEYTGEFKKIIWPSRKVLLKQTVTVIVTSLLFGLVIFCMDSIYNLGVQLFVGMIG